MTVQSCYLSFSNGEVCGINQTCSCPPCFMGDRYETSVNVVRFPLTTSIKWDIDNDASASFNWLIFFYIGTFSLILLFAILNAIPSLFKYFLSVRNSLNKVWYILNFVLYHWSAYDCWSSTSTPYCKIMFTNIQYTMFQLFLSF